MNSYTVYLDRHLQDHRVQTVRIMVEAASLDAALAEARARKPGYPKISMFWLDWPQPKQEV